VGLNNDGSEEPPRWLCDTNVRSGILAMLDLDRCEEEELRLRHERRAMQEWFSEEWDMVNTAYRNTGRSKLFSGLIPTKYFQRI